MPFEHINADRAWTLIRDNCALEPTEVTHVRSCEVCHEFLTTFLQLAKAAGFHASVKLPTRSDDDRKSA